MLLFVNRFRIWNRPITKLPFDFTQNILFSMHRVKFVQGQQIPRNRSLSDKERGSDPVSGLLRP